VEEAGGPTWLTDENCSELSPIECGPEESLKQKKDRETRLIMMLCEPNTDFKAHLQIHL